MLQRPEINDLSHQYIDLTVREKDYEFSKRITRLYPRNPEVWYMRAHSTNDMLESFFCLCRVFLLDPEHEKAKEKMYWLLYPLLQKDPSLTYVDEEEDFYRVHTGKGNLLIIPKNRAQYVTYPVKKGKTPLKLASRWLLYSVVGLPAAGIGTMIAAPVAIFFSVVALRQGTNQSDKARAKIIIMLACVFWLLSLLLAVLLYIHL